MGVLHDIAYVVGVRRGALLHMFPTTYVSEYMSWGRMSWGVCRGGMSWSVSVMVCRGVCRGERVSWGTDNMSWETAYVSWGPPNMSWVTMMLDMSWGYVVGVTPYVVRTTEICRGIHREVYVVGICRGGQWCWICRGGMSWESRPMS